MFHNIFLSLILFSTFIVFSLAISQTKIRKLERMNNLLSSRLSMLENKVLNDELDLRNNLENIWKELNETNEGSKNDFTYPGLTSIIEFELMKVQDKFRAIQYGFAEEKKTTRNLLGMMELELRNCILQMNVRQEMKEKMDHQKTENEIHVLQLELARNKRELSELSTEFKQIRKLISLFEASVKDCGTWERNGLSCYKVFIDEVEWNDAFEFCEQENAFLVEIDSEAENKFVINLFNLTIGKKIDNVDYYDYYYAHQNSYDTYTGPWIGASDIQTEGEWIWQHQGRNLRTGFQDWHVGEPNGNTDENCLHLLQTANFKWNDSPCKHSKPYVCEKPVPLK